MWGWLWRAPGLPLFLFRGIRVDAHPSVAFLIVAYSSLLGSTRFLGRYPEASGAAITAMIIASLLAAELSILLHEMGHTFQARREGLRADRITLWGLGGVSWNSGPRSAGAEFRLTIAGPSVSALLAVLCGGLGWLARRAALPPGVVGVAVLLSQFNAVAVAFNLFPVVPMDGGRILHSALWRVRGPRFAFTWVSRVGVLLASMVLLIGLTASFLGILPQMAGVNPGYSVFLEGLIMLAMTISYRSAMQVRPRGREELVVRDLVDGPCPGDVRSPDVTVAEFLDHAAPSGGYGTAASAVFHHGRMVGVITLGLATSVAVDERGRTTVAEVMLRKEDAVVLQPGTPVGEAFRRLQVASRRGVIMERGRVTAVIPASDLADVLLRVNDAARGVGVRRA
jgi:Zn-dependent protease